MDEEEYLEFLAVDLKAVAGRARVPREFNPATGEVDALAEPSCPLGERLSVHAREAKGAFDRVGGAQHLVREGVVNGTDSTARRWLRL